MPQTRVMDFQLGLRIKGNRVLRCGLLNPMRNRTSSQRIDVCDYLPQWPSRLRNRNRNLLKTCLRWGLIKPQKVRNYGLGKVISVMIYMHTLKSHVCLQRCLPLSCFACAFSLNACLMIFHCPRWGFQLQCHSLHFDAPRRHTQSRVVVVVVVCLVPFRMLQACNECLITFRTPFYSHR